MTKLAFVFMLIIAVVVSQTIFAQDKPVEKKVEKVVKVKKDAMKKGKEKMECCNKCTGEKCDGTCCAKCAECKKAYKEKCEKEGKGTCTKDSTVKCEKQNMKKKSIMKEEVKTEEKK